MESRYGRLARVQMKPTIDDLLAGAFLLIIVVILMVFM